MSKPRAKYSIIGFQYRFSIDGRTWGSWSTPLDHHPERLNKAEFEERFDYNLQNGTLQIRDIYVKEGDGEPQ